MRPWLILFLSAVFTSSCTETIKYPEGSKPYVVAKTGDAVRVDGLSVIRLKSNELFGSFSYWTSGRGSDKGTSQHQLVASGNNGNSFRLEKRLQYSNLGDINASHYQQENGHLLMLYLTQSNFTTQEASLVKSVSVDGGKTYGDPVYIAGGVGSGQRWIAAPGRIFQLSDGTLLYPVARRSFSNEGHRYGFMFQSHDDGETWTIARKTSGDTLVITSASIYNYATEPGLYQASNGDLYYYFRSRDGYVRGARLTRTGDNFSFDSIVNILPAPASATDIRYVPAIRKYMAVHNDIADIIDGNVATGRENLVYSLSDSGQPGTFRQMPNKIKASTGNGDFVIQPYIFADEGVDGALVAYTVFASKGNAFYWQYIRFLSRDLLLSDTKR